MILPIVSLLVVALNAVAQEPKVIPVAEARRDGNRDFVPDRLGETVVLRGVITAADNLEHPTYLQDATGGMALYRGGKGKSLLLERLQQGALIEVRGQIRQSRGEEGLLVEDIRLMGTAPLPEPRKVKVAELLGETYSGQLVRVSGELIVPEGAGQRKNLTLRDESGEIILHLHGRNLVEPKFVQRLVNGEVEVAGILEQKKDLPPFDSGYRLVPREPADFRFPWVPPYRAIALASLLLFSLSVTVHFWQQRKGAERRACEMAAVVTEGERAEVALRESEERFRTLFEEAPIAYHEIDRDGVVRRVNRVECELLGFRAEEILGRPVWEFVAPEERETSRRAVHRKLSGEQVLVPFQRPYLRRDGTRLVLDIHENSIQDSAGNPAGIRSALLDITEQQRSQAALRESQAQTRLILDTAHEAFVATDAHGAIIDWNKEAENTFGWSREEIIGKPFWETMIPAQYREAHRQGAQHLLAAGEGSVLNKRVELAVLHRDGHEFPVEMTVASVRMGDRHILTAFLHDITERKRAQEEVARARDLAVESARLKAEFLANMSHEIRTPLNGIIGMTELALDTELTPEQWEYVSTARESANSLLTVVNDILDFSKIEAGKLDLDLIDFSLRYTLENTMKTLALRAHQKGLELASQTLPEVPDALTGDPGRLRQIIVNLVGNAIKFTDRGEVVVRIGTEPQAGDEVRVHFAVSDTGSGIPRDRMGVIFEAFRQADSSTTRRYGGTGLGLTISSRLVEMMGGKMWVESEAGRGSTFHFTASFALQRKPARCPGPLQMPNLEGLHVLVVDDNATNRRILEEMLSNWHMIATAAASGPDGFDLMVNARDAGRPFPLVLIDACMPEMDGFALAKKIKQDPQLAGATIMMLTSAGQRGDAARCRQLGVAAYLIKPIRQSELLDAIMHALGQPCSEAPQALVTRHSLSETRGRLHILVAEDNVVNQQLAVRLLEKRGYLVAVARNGLEAMAALENKPFDLVLMDVQMPEMDGFAATAAIREKEEAAGRHTPIVAMTAHAMKGDRERCLAAGMDDYIAKPIRPTELFEIIEVLVSASDEDKPGASAAPSSDPIPDKSVVLARVEGDLELLEKMVNVFFEDSTNLLAAIGAAIVRRDGPALEKAAHAFKGSVSNFGAQAASEAALRLEWMGRQGNWTEADAAWAALQNEVVRLQPALVALGREVLQCGS